MCVVLRLINVELKSVVGYFYEVMNRGLRNRYTITSAMLMLDIRSFVIIN